MIDTPTAVGLLRLSRKRTPRPISRVMRSQNTGKGRHEAALKFGDCAVYALAVSEAEPLLFEGTDFGATNVEAVV